MGGGDPDIRVDILQLRFKQCEVFGISRTSQADTSLESVRGASGFLSAEDPSREAFGIPTRFREGVYIPVGRGNVSEKGTHGIRR